MNEAMRLFEEMNLEYENIYNEDDERRACNSIWYN